MKKSNKGLIITIVILSILLASVSGGLVYDKVFNKNELKEVEREDIANKKEESKTNNNTTETEEEELPNYHNIYNVVENLIINNSHTSHCGVGMSNYFYRYDSINVTNMDYDILMSMVMDQYVESQDIEPYEINSYYSKEKYINSTDLEEHFKTIFGDQIKYQTKDFTYNLSKWKYDASNNRYIYSQLEGGNVCISYRKNKINKVMKTNNTIEVYDILEFGQVAGGDYDMVEVYKDPSFKQLVTTFKKSSKIDSSEYESKLNQYKYIFKLNADGNYYFYGVELVK